MIVLKVIGIILAVFLGIVFLLILLLAAADWTLRFRLESDIWSISDILNAMMMLPNLTLLFICRKEIKKMR